MATNRTQILSGPGAIVVGSGSPPLIIHDADGISAEYATPTSDIPSSMIGKLDTIKTDQTGTVSATPSGNFSQAILDHFYPHRSPVIGKSMMGADDKPLRIVSRTGGLNDAGRKVVFVCAALATPPPLRLSPILTSFGQAQWYACLGKAKAPEDALALYEIGDEAYTLGEPDRTGLAGHHYTGIWASLNIPDTAEGWTVDIELNWEPVVVDSVGTIDWTLGSATARARCIPLGLTEAEILDALSATNPRGSSIATANDLVISSPSGLVVTLKSAGLETGPLRWGTTMLRAGELGFVAHITGGQLYSVAMAAATPAT